MSAEQAEKSVSKASQHTTNIPEIERLFAKKKKEDLEKANKKQKAKDAINSTLLMT